MDISPFTVEDSITGEAEIAEAVKSLRLNCSGGPSWIWAEDLCQWLWEAMWEEDMYGSNWEKVAALVQVAFWDGSLVKSCA